MRTGKDIPKQFLKIGNDQIIDICINIISSHKYCKYLIVVINKNYEKYYKIKFKKKNIVFIMGGKTRHESVSKAIKVLPKNDLLLLIHDAARPGINHLIIDNLINNLKNDFSCVIPTLAMNDSIIKKDKVVSSLKRQNIYRIQTPQIFSANVLKYEDFDKNNKATDESEIVLKKNKKVKLIEGSEKLNKITTKWDYKFLMNSLDKKIETRIGNGFDVHAFRQEPSKLILGGIIIDYPFGLKGHSDADVLLHSVTDAILGSISMGDIGTHFPPNKKKWENAKSSIFLEKSLKMLKEKDGEIINLDITVICEEPKIVKYANKILKNLSKLLRIKQEKISLKATTTEGLGFTGRKEGIAVTSNILVNIKS